MDKDLYSAIDNNLFTIEHEVWIQHLPRILTIQIKQNFAPETFQFPQILFPERCLIENQDLVRSLRDKDSALKKSIRTLENSIQRYQSYNRQVLSLDNLLIHACKFLETLSTEKRGESQDDLLLYNPDNLSEDAHNPQLQAAIETIFNYAEISKHQKEHMEEQLALLKVTQTELFSCSELQNEPYYLHSIIIQDRNSRTDKYIHIRDGNVWNKYSDSKVSPISEEEALAEAIVGDGAKSLHMLTYIHSSLLPKSNSRTFALAESGAITDRYNSFIQVQLKEQIDGENKRLELEVAEWELLSRLKDLYFRRLTTIERYFSLRNTEKSEFIKFDLFNFHMHLKLKEKNDILKWHLLDTCLKDLQGIGISSLNPEDNFYSILHSDFIKQHKRSPVSLVLSEAQERSLKREYRRYRRNYIGASVCIYLIEKLIVEQFHEAIQAVFWYYSECPRSTEYSHSILELLKILLLKLTSGLKTLSNGELAHWANLVKSTALALLDKTDKVYLVLLDRIPEVEEKTEVAQKRTSELKELKNTEEIYQWTKGWKKGSLATRYMESRASFLSCPLVPWLHIYEQILQNSPDVATLFEEADEFHSISYHLE